VNYFFLIPALAFLVALRYLKPHVLVWMSAWWLVAMVILKFAMRPPMPASIVGLYMAIMTAVLFLYLTADSGRLQDATTATTRFFQDKKFNPILWVFIFLIPLIAGVNAYHESARSVVAPANVRTIHPAPPGEMNFKGKKIDLLKVSNPFRELEKKDTASFASHVSEGRKIYYQNCVFCHGDNMQGDGIYSHGFDPLPANFQDPTTIAMLQESYLFWRIAKGGPGLPDESTPWASAMPAWEKYLSEDDIWNVILFLYHFTGKKPRAQENAE